MASQVLDATYYVLRHIPDTSSTPCPLPMPLQSDFDFDAQQAATHHLHLKEAFITYEAMFRQLISSSQEPHRSHISSSSDPEITSTVVKGSDTELPPIDAPHPGNLPLLRDKDAVLPSPDLKPPVLSFSHFLPPLNEDPGSIIALSLYFFAPLLTSLPRWPRDEIHNLPAP